MITNLYAVYDLKLQTYSRPFHEMTDEAAIRLFSDAVNDAQPTNQWNKHPEDFNLYKLGTYSDQFGVFENELVSLVSAVSVFKQPKLPGIDFEALLPKPHTVKKE